MASFQRNRVSPYRSSQGESPSQDGTDGDAGNGNGSKRRLPCNRADRGCVASWGQDHLAGNGADFLLVLKLENFQGTLAVKQLAMQPWVRWERVGSPTVWLAA